MGKINIIVRMIEEGGFENHFLRIINGKLLFVEMENNDSYEYFGDDWAIEGSETYILILSNHVSLTLEHFSLVNRKVLVVKKHHLSFDESNR